MQSNTTKRSGPDSVLSYDRKSTKPSKALQGHRTDIPLCMEMYGVVW